MASDGDEGKSQTPLTFKHGRGPDNNCAIPARVQYRLEKNENSLETVTSRKKQLRKQHSAMIVILQRLFKRSESYKKIIAM